MFYQMVSLWSTDGISAALLIYQNLFYLFPSTYVSPHSSREFVVFPRPHNDTVRYWITRRERTKPGQRCPAWVTLVLCRWRPRKFKQSSSRQAGPRSHSVYRQGLHARVIQLLYRLGTCQDVTMESSGFMNGENIACTHFERLAVSLSVCLSVCPSARLPMGLSVCLSIRLSVCLSVCLSVYPSVCLSVCLSVCPFYACKCLRLSACMPGSPCK